MPATLPSRVRPFCQPSLQQHKRVVMAPTWVAQRTAQRIQEAARPPSRCFAAPRRRKSCATTQASVAVLEKELKQTQQNTVKVSFKLPYRCHFGQNVYLVGAGEELGNWNIQDSKLMKWSDGDIWVVEVELGRKHYDHLEYKYVVKNPDGGVSAWKPGSNCKVPVSDLPEVPEKISVFDAWDGTFHDVQVMLHRSSTPDYSQHTNTPSPTFTIPASSSTDGSSRELPEAMLHTVYHSPRGGGTEGSDTVVFSFAANGDKVLETATTTSTTKPPSISQARAGYMPGAIPQPALQAASTPTPGRRPSAAVPPIPTPVPIPNPTTGSSTTTTTTTSSSTTSSSTTSSAAATAAAAPSSSSSAAASAAPPPGEWKPGSFATTYQRSRRRWRRRAAKSAGLNGTDPFASPAAPASSQTKAAAGGSVEDSMDEEDAQAVSHLSMVLSERNAVENAMKRALQEIDFHLQESMELGSTVTDPSHAERLELDRKLAAASMRVTAYNKVLNACPNVKELKAAIDYENGA